MIIKLKRRTQPFRPNVNGYIYTKKAFDTAMDHYMECGGKVFLAPCADRMSELYGNFGRSNIDPMFYIGYIDHYSDEYIWIQVENDNDLMKKYLKDTNNLEVYMKYICDLSNFEYYDKDSKIIKRLKIQCFDVPCIPRNDFKFLNKV